MFKDYLVPFILPPTEVMWEAAYAEMINALDDILLRYSLLSPVEQRCDNEFLYDALNIDEAPIHYSKVFTTIYPYMRVIAFSFEDHWLDRVSVTRIHGDTIRVNATYIPKRG